MYKLSDFERSSKNLYRISKIFSVIVCVIILFVIIFNVTLMIKAYSNPNELPSFLGIKSFVIVSESMEPTINRNDVIFIKEVPRESLKIGDIISFKVGNYINTHRILRIEEKNGEIVYITKGDNNNSEDRGYVKFQDIEGKYLFKIPGFGNVTNILKSKIMLVILLVILIIIAYHEVKTSKRRLKRKEERYQFNKNLIEEVVKRKEEK